MSLHTLDWTTILSQIENFCSSGQAKGIVQKWRALDTADAALERARAIFEASSLVQTGIRPSMESLELFESWHVRLRKKAVLTTLDLGDVRHFCLETLALREALSETQNAWSESTAERLMPAEEPLSAIEQILTAGGEIRSDASEKLYQLFREKEQLARQVQSALDKAVRDHKVQTFLQDRFVTTREGRWVLPIRSGSQHFVPGVIHGSSQTKQTVFIEPEGVIPLNNRLRQGEVEIEDEIERILLEISNYLSGLQGGFRTTFDALLDCDTTLASAQFSIRTEGQMFEFSDRELRLDGLAHPLMVFGSQNVIRNDILMNEASAILVLSGPNAGGKTVLMKSIGLACQMARAGLPVSATFARLLFFKEILVDIGDAQNVGENLSTFAAHLKFLNHASRVSGFDHLILVDEICGSTDPEEGGALACAFIETFATQNVFSVVTTHLSQVKNGLRASPGIVHGSLEYDRERGIPTYQYLAGLAGDSLALQTARRIAIDPAILDRALEHLSPEARQRAQELSDLQEMKSGIQSLQTEMQKERKALQRERERYQKLIDDFGKQKAAKLEKIVEQSEKKVDDWISALSAEAVLKKHSARQEIKTQLPQIVRASVGPVGGAPQSAIDSAEAFARAFPPGSKVFVPSLGRDGLVQSAPNSKGEVLVLSNSVRLQILWRDLKPADRSVNPTSQLLRKVAPGSVSAIGHGPRVLDVRGHTVEESLSEIEVAIDQALTLQEDRFKIVHGHGTESLKKAIRTALSRNVVVKKWFASDQNDGATWVEL